MTSPWDLLVVGGGSAGIVAAKTGASLGARVLLVERARPGGDCLWTGCVPSKSLLAAASAAADAAAASSLGIDVNGISVDFARVMAHVRSAIRTIEPADSPEALEAAGVRVRTGDLTFTGRHRADVDGEAVEFRQAILCTGSSPALPPIPGLAAVEPLTSDTVWELDELPGGSPSSAEETSAASWVRPSRASARSSPSSRVRTRSSRVKTRTPRRSSLRPSSGTASR